MSVDQIVIIDADDEVVVSEVRPVAVTQPSLASNQAQSLPSSGLVMEVDPQLSGNATTSTSNTIAEGSHLKESRGNLGQTAINVVSIVADNSSPDDFKGTSAKRKKRPASSSPEPTRDDEGQCCPICFEPWTISGDHRLACLNCGHLFGKSCIEKWLAGKKQNKCPKCNAPAKAKHIRPIYASVVKAIDTYERDDMLKQLEQEKSARKEAEEAKVRALLNFNVARAECERLKSELERQVKQASRFQSSSSQESSSQGSSSQGRAANCKYMRENSWQVSQCGARVMDYDSYTGILVISKPSPNPLFPGFGVLKISSLDSNHSQFIPIHNKDIRDAVFSSENNGLLLTGGMDKMLKITNVQTNNTVLSYTNPAGVLSCAWNTNDSNYIYSGLSNGECYVFDIRQTSTHLTVLKNQESKQPIFSLAYVPRHPSFNMSGVITGSMAGCYFWDNSSVNTDYVVHRLNLPTLGFITCVRFEPTTGHCLVSQKPSRMCNKYGHSIFKLNGRGSDHLSNVEIAEGDRTGSGTASLDLVVTCYGGSMQMPLGHSALFPCPDDDSKLLACAGEAETRSAIVWDGSTGKVFQSLPHHGEMVLDVCPMQTNMLATLTEKTLSLYKWQ